MLMAANGVDFGALCVAPNDNLTTKKGISVKSFMPRSIVSSKETLNLGIIIQTN